MANLNDKERLAFGEEDPTSPDPIELELTAVEGSEVLDSGSDDDIDRSLDHVGEGRQVDRNLDAAEEELAEKQFESEVEKQQEAYEAQAKDLEEKAESGLWKPTKQDWLIAGAVALGAYGLWRLLKPKKPKVANTPPKSEASSWVPWAIGGLGVLGVGLYMGQDRIRQSMAATVLGEGVKKAREVADEKIDEAKAAVQAQIEEHGLDETALKLFVGESTPIESMAAAKIGVSKLTLSLLSDNYFGQLTDFHDNPENAGKSFIEENEGFKRFAKLLQAKDIDFKAEEEALIKAFNAQNPPVEKTKTIAKSIYELGSQGVWGEVSKDQIEQSEVPSEEMGVDTLIGNEHIAPNFTNALFNSEASWETWGDELVKAAGADGIDLLMTKDAVYVIYGVTCYFVSKSIVVYSAIAEFATGSPGEAWNTYVDEVGGLTLIGFTATGALTGYARGMVYNPNSNMLYAAAGALKGFTFPVSASIKAPGAIFDRFQYARAGIQDVSRGRQRLTNRSNYLQALQFERSTAEYHAKRYAELYDRLMVSTPSLSDRVMNTGLSPIKSVSEGRLYRLMMRHARLYIEAREGFKTILNDNIDEAIDFSGVGNNDNLKDNLKFLRDEVVQGNASGSFETLFKADNLPELDDVNHRASRATTELIDQAMRELSEDQLDRLSRLGIKASALGRVAELGLSSDKVDELILALEQNPKYKELFEQILEDVNHIRTFRALNQSFTIKPSKLKAASMAGGALFEMMTITLGYRDAEDKVSYLVRSGVEMASFTGAFKLSSGVIGRIPVVNHPFVRYPASMLLGLIGTTAAGEMTESAWESYGVPAIMRRWPNYEQDLASSNGLNGLNDVISVATIIPSAWEVVKAADALSLGLRNSVSADTDPLAYLTETVRAMNYHPADDKDPETGMRRRGAFFDDIHIRDMDTLRDAAKYELSKLRAELASNQRQLEQALSRPDADINKLNEFKNRMQSLLKQIAKVESFADDSWLDYELNLINIQRKIYLTQLEQEFREMTGSVFGGEAAYPASKLYEQLMSDIETSGEIKTESKEGSVDTQELWRSLVGKRVKIQVPDHSTGEVVEREFTFEQFIMMKVEVRRKERLLTVFKERFTE
jgi:hypothetical protein